MPKMVKVGRLEAIVDEKDFEFISRFNWFLRRGYAIRKRLSGESGPTTISMHREILEAPNGLDVDHINGNSLDNRRENLRLATRSQNGGNSISRKPHSSRFKGVSWDKCRARWQANIGVRRRLISLGYFKEEEKAAERYFGEFARPNFVIEEDGRG